MGDEMRGCKDDLKVSYPRDLIDGAQNCDGDDRDKKGLMGTIINSLWGHTECKVPVGLLIRDSQ